MTETTSDSSSHLDLDALADVLAGEAGPDDSAHLRGCGSCTSRLAELEAAEGRVVSVLSTLPPPPVPDDLADRLTAALAEQEPLQPARASVTALPAASTRRRSWLPAAAAAVLLVSGAGLGWSLVNGGSDSADQAASGDAGVTVTASGIDYADPAAVTAALPGVLAGDAAGGGTSRATTEDSSAAAAEDSAVAEAEAPAAAMSAGDPLERLRTPDGLLACLAGLQASPDEAPVEPLAVDYATYEGAPALAVVLPDPDPAKLSVFVVGPECAQADAALLHFVRVDAP